MLISILIRTNEINQHGGLPHPLDCFVRAKFLFYNSMIKSDSTKFIITCKVCSLALTPSSSVFQRGEVSDAPPVRVHFVKSIS